MTMLSTFLADRAVTAEPPATYGVTLHKPRTAGLADLIVNNINIF